MKIETGFVPPLRSILGVLLTVVWTFAIALAAGGGWLLRDASVREPEIESLRERLASLEQSRTNLPNDLPSVQELTDLKQRVGLLRELGGPAAGTFSSVLAELEALLPDSVRLVNLHYLVRDRSVELTAESSGAEPLTRFLLALERSARFSGVMLARQAQRDGAAGKTVQFEIRLKEGP